MIYHVLKYFKMKKLAIVCLSLLVVLTSLFSCKKEDTTIVKGYVRSTSGEPVSQAKITVANKYYTCWKCLLFCSGSTECGMLEKVKKSTVTDKNGYYEVEFLTKEIVSDSKNYFIAMVEKAKFATIADTTYPTDLGAAKTIKIKPQGNIRINFIDDINVNIGDFDGIRWDINKDESYSFYTVTNSPKLVNVAVDLNKKAVFNWYSYKIDGYKGGVKVFTGQTETITVNEQKDYDVFIRY
jgi:hypothetical protein